MTSGSDSLAALQSAINYTFCDPSLLSLALRHKSSGQPNNERLEFLGDAILGAIVADTLYSIPSILAEGELTVARASLVSGPALTGVARALELDKLMQLGKGERNAGAVRDSILEDAVEAIVGAVFLDSDFETARTTVLKLLGDKLAVIEGGRVAKDPKTELQELMQSTKNDLPRYKVIAEEGPPHDRLFKVACDIAIVPERTIAQARSRRTAEQAAAKMMLEKIQLVDSSMVARD